MATYAASAVIERGAQKAGFPFVRLETLLSWLVVAVGVELVVLRTLTRIAIHVPGLEAIAGPYEALADAGRFAYYVATVIAVLVVVTLAVTAWRTTSAGGRVIATGLISLLIAAAALRTGPGLGEAAALNTLLLGSIVVVGIGVGMGLGRLPGLAVLVATSAVALSGSFSVGEMWAAEGAGTGVPAGVLDMAEWGAVAFAITLPWTLGALPTGSRRPSIAGAVAATAVLALLLGNPHTTRFLLLWTHGLSGSLPAVAYAAAAGCVVATAVALYSRHAPIAASGLLLLVAGGVAMQNTYQSMLVGIGLACLVFSTVRQDQGTAEGLSDHRY